MQSLRVFLPQERLNRIEMQKKNKKKTKREREV